MKDCLQSGRGEGGIKSYSSLRGEKEIKDEKERAIFDVISVS
jgi:hypothetical protein